jgi:glycosyltransferase involved in cell wall biosynthesis
MKNILFISYDGLTDPLGQSQIIPYILGLTEFGYQFTILSCDKPDKYLLHKERIQEILSSYPIKWTSIPYHKNPPILSTVYDMMRMKRKARQLHLEDKFDLVHTRAGTPALIGLWLKKKYGIKFLNDLRDFFADSRIDSGSWNLKNPVYKSVYHYLKTKETQSINENDGIVCLTYAAEKIIKERPDYTEKIPLQVIPCCVDMTLFNPENINPQSRLAIAEELEIQDSDYIISYLGSIGSWYLTDKMMECFKIILDKIPAVKFLLISPDNHETIYEKAIAYGINKKKIIIKAANRKEVPVLLSFSNYSMFFIKPCYSKQASSPTKHGEIMAMGIPVITNNGVGDMAKIIKASNSGIVLEELNENNFLELAAKLSNRIYFDKKAIRDGAKKYYNLENAISKYKSIYDRILNS